MSKTGTFHLNSGIYRDFPNVNFRPTLTLQKVFKGYFRVLCENSDLKTCIAALNPDFLNLF